MSAEKCISDAARAHEWTVRRVRVRGGIRLELRRDLHLVEVELDHAGEIRRRPVLLGARRDGVIERRATRRSVEQVLAWLAEPPEGVPGT